MRNYFKRTLTCTLEVFDDVEFCREVNAGGGGGG